MKRFKLFLAMAALACAIGQAVQMVRGGVVEKIEALLPQGGEQPAE